jgi:hypothetical protein
MNDFEELQKVSGSFERPTPGRAPRNASFGPNRLRLALTPRGFFSNMAVLIFLKGEPSMKSVTEFANVTLNLGLKAKDALVAEGKGAEELLAGLGEKFKMEGEKLKHFWNALEVAVKHPENLKRILVQTYNEGENAPPKAEKVEEHHYTPDFHVDPKKATAVKADDRNGRGGKGGGRGGKGGGKGGEKESPWGLSEEQKKAKKLAQSAAAAANKKA